MSFMNNVFQDICRCHSRIIRFRTPTNVIRGYAFFLYDNTLIFFFKTEIFQLASILGFSIYFTLFQGDVLSLNHQIRAFEDCLLFGCLSSSSSSSLSHYLFLVGGGGNDYTLNFFRRNPNSSLSTLQAFTDNLTHSLTLHLQVSNLILFTVGRI